MKTKILYRLAIAAIITGSLFTSCKKNSAAADNGTSSSDLQVQSDDQTRVSNESDAVEDDANATIEGVQGVNTTIVCDATITVDSSSDPRTITLTYNGNTGCSATRTRTGSVVISIPANTRWRDTGAVITVKFLNLKITSLIDNKSITINGTHTYTNVSGGGLEDLYLAKAQSIIHTITSNNMSVTFDNNAQRTWNVARQRTFIWSGSNQNLTIAATGMHTEGSTTGISEWGLNRFGNSFTTVIAPNNPIIVQSGCGWRVTSGQVQITGSAVTTTVTFGLDANGETVLACPTGSYYFKLVWQGPNNTYTFISPY
jgi:hypothetical protein